MDVNGCVISDFNVNIERVKTCFQQEAHLESHFARTINEITSFTVALWPPRKR